eukprot:TRINITY_DN3570_c0_g1_i3.p1 TRINITY_DN3570_c0_g1~~TRINITY_DN3570_c0_g1_i3.p1  ORF type:complete len:331 (-),score=47.04 TRINITY_DN3570_c0_g1_i3:95-1087(-)
MVGKILAYLVCLCCLLGSTFAYENPVVNNQCPDPGVFLLDEKTYFAVTTTVNDSQVDKYPMRISNDLVNWTQIGYVFNGKNTPSWAVNSFWAPEIHYISGNYFVYFAARDKTGRLCVGVAVSQSGNIDGPYYDPLGAPLLRNASVGYIDATVFYDEPTNEYYILWKQDGNGNSPQIPSIIFAQKLSKSGTSVVGERYSLIQNDLPWEGAVVEGPWLIYNSPYYYLFYSANAYYDQTYCLGVARSKNITSGFSKFPTPIVKSNSKWIGPGHCSVVNIKNTNRWEIVYHSWLVNYVGGNNDRVLMIDSLLWENDWPYVNTTSPSISQQPNPI